jgi:hypothetical protein
LLRDHYKRLIFRIFSSTLPRKPLSYRTQSNSDQPEKFNFGDVLGNRRPKERISDRNDLPRQSDAARLSLTFWREAARPLYFAAVFPYFSFIRIFIFSHNFLLCSYHVEPLRVWTLMIIMTRIRCSTDTNPCSDICGVGSTFYLGSS